MAAGVGGLDEELTVSLLRGQHIVDDGLALVIQFAAGALVEAELGVDELTAVVGQPLGAVEPDRADRAALLAAGQRHLDGPARLVPLLAVADQGVDPDGGLGFVVGGPTTVEIAVLLDQLEGIARPVFSLRLHDIEVRQEQDRLGLGVLAGQHGDQPAVEGQAGGGENRQFAVGEAGDLHPGRHPLGGERAATH